jgi:GAF domain-containing protein
MHAEISEAVDLATERHEPSQEADLRDLPSTPVNDTILRAGYRARLLLPLMRSGDVIGALVVRRQAPGEFSASTVELLETFAAQSALAIQNARLFSELDRVMERQHGHGGAEANGGRHPGQVRQHRQRCRHDTMAREVVFGKPYGVKAKLLRPAYLL